MDTDNPPNKVTLVSAFFESKDPSDAFAIFDLSHLETKLDAYQLPWPMSIRHLQEQIISFTVGADLSSLDNVDEVLKALELQRKLNHQHFIFEAPHDLPEQKPPIHVGDNVLEEQRPDISEGVNSVKDEQKLDINDDIVKLEDSGYISSCCE
ncbi:unnamed protein product [Calypogeia fissa]